MHGQCAGNARGAPRDVVVRGRNVGGQRTQGVERRLAGVGGSGVGVEVVEVVEVVEGVGVG